MSSPLRLTSLNMMIWKMEKRVETKSKLSMLNGKVTAFSALNELLRFSNGSWIE